MKKREAAVAEQEEVYRRELERISGLSAQEAKELIIKNLENDARHDAQALLNKIEQIEWNIVDSLEEIVAKIRN